MRTTFLGILVVLLFASFLTWVTAPRQQTDAPILYWVTDMHPGREAQVRVFHEWLEKNGHPRIELRLDAANNDISKKLIQGVSGVAGEILDCYRGKQDMLYLYQAGILQDITEWAEEFGFGPEATWDSIVPDMVIDGKQYGFPRNVSTVMYWVNKDTFARYGIEPPSGPWTWDEFEAMGREFVARANADNPRPRRFFAVPDPSFPMVLPTIMLRSAGMDLFNETLTGSAIDDPRFAMVLERIHQWMFIDRIIPNSADAASFAGAAGFGGAYLHLFNEGTFGLFMLGRYAVLRFRQFDPIQLGVVEPPHLDYRNTLIFSGLPTLFRNAPNSHLAKYFFAFMASEEYNMLIVEDGDALPPNPKFTRTEAFLRPPDHPNEWGAHEAFATAAEDLAITYTNSPFVLPFDVNRMLQRSVDLFFNGMIPSDRVGRQFVEGIDQAIAENLEDRPQLRSEFDRRAALQEKIDALRAEGAPIPREWIYNPFHLKYYADKNLLL